MTVPELGQFYVAVTTHWDVHPGQQEPYCLGSILGPLIFGNLHRCTRIIFRTIMQRHVCCHTAPGTVMPGLGLTGLRKTSWACKVAPYCWCTWRKRYWRNTREFVQMTVPQIGGMYEVPCCSMNHKKCPLLATSGESPHRSPR